MKNNYPNIKGFTKRNIERMIQFYKTYKDDEIATPLVTQLSWTNNLLIISGSKTKEERHFYLKLAVKNNYSKRELDRQISSSYYERYMLSDGNKLPSTIKTIDEDDYPNTRILDIKACFIPIKNPKNGQCSWYVWKNYTSKRNFIEEHNKHVILNQEYNKKYGIKNEIGRFPKNRNEIIDLDYFDLD